MATTITKLFPTGILQSSVAFDEVTQSAIKNLLTYTEDFTQWSKNTAPNDYTVTANVIAAPNGTITADLIIKSTGAGSSSISFKVFSGAINTAYCGSIYIKAGGYSKVHVGFSNSAFNNTSYGANIDLATGTINTILGGSTVTVQNAGNGWYRVSVTATSNTSGGNYVFRIVPLDNTYSTNFAGDGVSGIYVWGAQVELGSVATPYQGIGASGVVVTPDYSVKLSPTGVYAAQFDEVTPSPIKNLLTYTEQFNQSVYGKQRSSIGAIDTIAAPNGTLTAEKFIEDATATSTHYINSAYATSVGLPTGSIYVKAGERTFCELRIILNSGGGFASNSFVVDLSTGAIVTGAAYGTLTNAGNGWYRLSATATTSGTNYAIRLGIFQSSSVFSYTGNGVSGLYIWGAQLEDNSTVTPYQGIGAAGVIVTPDFAERRTSTGTYLVSGYFDEYTYTIAPF